MSLNSDPSNDTALFEAVDSYPWSTDGEFQLGLQSILSQSKSAPQSEVLTLRAQTFYYARKHNVEVDFQEYLAWHNRRKRQQNSNVDGADQTQENRAPQTQSQPQENGTEEQIQASAPQISIQPQTQTEQPRHPTNFSHIVDLITRGEPVPGIREIPTTLLSGQETQPTQARRKKPWEKDEPASVAT